MNIKIKKAASQADFEMVTPNFIYNRFDLFCAEGEYGAVSLTSDGHKKIIEYRLDGSSAELGLWLTPITREELEQILLYIRRMHPDVSKVTFKNAVLPYGKATEHNHFRIEFPENGEEMTARVSPMSLRKIRRKNRHAEEAYGEMKLEEYYGDDIPLELVETFFKYKLATHRRVYNMTAAEYLKRYHVSTCYVVKFGERIGAMRFCCEQCPVVYGENHAYDPEMKDYSLGRFIFLHSLVRSAEKHHSRIFIAGGDYEYKTHYGSIEETVYDCEVDMSKVDFYAIPPQTFGSRVRRFFRTHLPKSLVKKLLSLMARIK